MTTDELLAYYQSLLIVQYINKPKAQGTIGALVAAIVADQIGVQVRDAFNIDTAVGVQLDTLASYRGLDRHVYGLNLTKTYFPFSDYSTTRAYGFAAYSQSEPDIGWYFLMYRDTTAVLYTMNDTELRTVLKFRTEAHRSDHSLQAIDALLFKYFGKYVQMTDNGDMSITYNDLPSDPSNLFVLVNGSESLPRPAGVRLIITNV